MPFVYETGLIDRDLQFAIKLAKTVEQPATDSWAIDRRRKAILICFEVGYVGGRGTPGGKYFLFVAGEAHQIYARYSAQGSLVTYDKVHLVNPQAAGTAAPVLLKVASEALEVLGKGNVAAVMVQVLRGR